MDFIEFMECQEWLSRLPNDFYSHFTLPYEIEELLEGNCNILREKDEKDGGESVDDILWFARSDGMDCTQFPFRINVMKVKWNEIYVGFLVFVFDNVQFLVDTDVLHRYRKAVEEDETKHILFYFPDVTVRIYKEGNNQVEVLNLICKRLKSSHIDAPKKLRYEVDELFTTFLNTPLVQPAPLSVDEDRLLRKKLTQFRKLLSLIPSWRSTEITPNSPGGILRDGMRTPRTQQIQQQQRVNRQINDTSQISTIGASLRGLGGGGGGVTFQRLESPPFPSSKRIKEWNSLLSYYLKSEVTEYHSSHLENYFHENFFKKKKKKKKRRRRRRKKRMMDEDEMEDEDEGEDDDDEEEEEVVVSDDLKKRKDSFLFEKDRNQILESSADNFEKQIDSCEDIMTTEIMNFVEEIFPTPDDPTYSEPTEEQLGELSSKIENLERIYQAKTNLSFLPRKYFTTQVIRNSRNSNKE